MSIVDRFKAAMTAAKSVPKGVKVSPGLFAELRKADLIAMRDVAAWGIVDLGFQMPFYGDTVVICDPELLLSNIEFQLPPNV